MKKSILTLVAVAFLFTAVPSNANTDNTTPVTNPSNSVEVNTMLKRLVEIKEMNKSSLTRMDKKVLREEVQTIKGELKRQGSSVSISVGAIIIILLLILLL